jgi:sec-independent protein translocase protein TatB
MTVDAKATHRSLSFLLLPRGSMMKPMSFSETIFLFFLALVIFGPKKLPEIARQAGKLLNEFRRASNEFKSQIEQEIAHIEVENKKSTTLQPATPPQCTTSRTLTLVPGGELPPAATLANSPVTQPVTQDDEPLFASTGSSPENPAGKANGSSANIGTLPASESAASEPVTSSSTSRESHA